MELDIDQAEMRSAAMGPLCMVKAILSCPKGLRPRPLRVRTVSRSSRGQDWEGEQQEGAQKPELRAPWTPCLSFLCAQRRALSRVWRGGVTGRAAHGRWKGQPGQRKVKQGGSTTPVWVGARGVQPPMPPLGPWAPQKSNLGNPASCITLPCSQEEGVACGTP